MVNIDHLDVQFDVEGEGDEAVFARLFARHIGRWHAAEQEASRRARRVEAERALGDRAPGEEP